MGIYETDQGKRGVDDTKSTGERAYCEDDLSNLIFESGGRECYKKNHKVGRRDYTF